MPDVAAASWPRSRKGAWWPEWGTPSWGVCLTLPLVGQLLPVEESYSQVSPAVNRGASRAGLGVAVIPLEFGLVILGERF